MSEIQKVSEKHEEIFAIEGFVQFLQSEGITLCEPHGNSLLYLPSHKSVTHLVYKFFKIDPVKLEEERRELLKSLGGN